jgi:hypothetical protein
MSDHQQGAGKVARFGRKVVPAGAARDRPPDRHALVTARRLALAALVVLVAALGTVATASADTGVVGDSLSHQTYESGGWYVDAVDGRTLGGKVGLVRSYQARFPVVVVALGSNDVNRRLTTATIGRVAGPCVVMTTVKVYGVTSFYNRKWVTYARRWNRAVWASGAIVADWNGLARVHPGWFLGDGLHLTAAGEVGYDRLLRTAVAAHEGSCEVAG